MPQLLERTFVHLGLGATAVAQADFTGGAWYEGYGTRHDGDGVEGRLVSMFSFAESWDSWEMHPHGEEVVLCTSGRMTIRQEMADGTRATVTLGPGEFAVNPRGCWHIADLDAPATAVFITAGWGTESRPR